MFFKNFRGSDTKKPRSTMNEAIMKQRLNALLIGDALICPKTGWRIDCVADPIYGDRQFIIKNPYSRSEGSKRKRLSATLKYLHDNFVPSTLELVVGGSLEKSHEQVFLPNTGYSPDVTQVQYYSVNNIAIEEGFFAPTYLVNRVTRWLVSLRKD